LSGSQTEAERRKKEGIDAESGIIVLFGYCFVLYL